VHPLHAVAPAFVEMAHRIVWCVAATTTPGGSPSTRVLHPIWSWDGQQLEGWIATSPSSPKARHLAATPALSLTYWHPDHDTCTADCDTSWEDAAGERALWERFSTTAEPLGYDPRIIPGWDAPDAPTFGALRLRPRRLRVLPGSLIRTGEGRQLTWRG